MRNVNVIRVYNLVDEKGNKLQLRLGTLNSQYDDVCISSADNGIRWSFVGKHIPMPVRSCTWFNGFTESVMLEWLKENGWYPHTSVDMDNGYARVYDLPKGNEDFARSEEDERTFCEVIRKLSHEGKMIAATRLYRYANGGDLRNAYHSIKEICSQP